MEFRVFFGKEFWWSRVLNMCLISLLLISISSKTMAQLTYPVQVNVNVPGPGPMLADYTVSGRIVFNVNLTDMQIGSRQVKFKIKIESQGGGQAYSAVSKTNSFSSPVTLYSGIPSMITGADVADLFDVNNLIITSSYQYKAQGVMPEGLYTIKLITYDKDLSYQLSNAEIGYATLFIAHLQPPLLTLPLLQTNIDLNSPSVTSTVFSWIPRNNGAPLNKVIKYKLFIYELPPGVSPNLAATGTPSLTFDSETPFYNLTNISLTNLAYKDEFAWRVKAYFPTVPGEPDYNLTFINDGMSEVFTFTNFKPCAPPTPLVLDNSIPLQLTANWIEASQAEFVGTELHYREKTRWTSWNLEKLSQGTTSKIINDLKSDTYYEAMVRSVCTTSTKTYYSDWKSFIDAKTDTNTTSASACIAPYNVQFGSSSSDINISWTEGNEAKEHPVYTVQYKLNTDTDWTIAANDITTSNYSFSSLPTSLPAGTYDIRVGSNCTDFTVSYSDVYTVTIPVSGTLSSCNFPLPFDVNVEVLEDKEQTKISWPTNNTEQVFKFYYRKRFEVDAAWESIITGVNYVVIDSLDYEVSYECKIEMDCGGGVKVSSPTKYFQLDDPLLTKGNGGNTGDCFPPDYATAEIKGTNDAPQIEFSWKAVSGAQSYKLKYKNLTVTNSQDSVIVVNPTTKYLLSLLPTNINNTFEYSVEARCDNKWSIPTQLNTIKVIIDPNKVSTCDSVTLVTPQKGDTTMNTFNLRWTRLSSATGYVIEYRPLSATTPAWYSINIPQPDEESPANPDQQVQGTVDNLDQDAEYEYRVKTLCGTNYSEYTSIRKIKTLKNKELDCGSKGDDLTLNETDLLAEMKVGDDIHANDFTFKVTKITSSTTSADGVYSGEASIDIEFWGKLSFTAEFTDAKFNIDHRLIDGKVILKGAELQYLPDEVRNLINDAISTINDSYDKLQDALEKIYDLGGIVKKDPVGHSVYNSALVTSPGESTGTIKVDKGTGAITNNTAQFEVNSGTTIAVINKDIANDVKNTLPVEGNSGSGTILDDATGKPSVSFAMASDQKYGYDAFSSGPGRLESVYEKANGTFIDWKSIGAGYLDKIVVNFGSATSEELAKIKFVSLAGIEYKLQEKNGVKFILVSGSLEGTVQEIYAWYADSNLSTKGLKLAKINVAAYKPRKNTVYIIPMKLSATAPSPEAFVADDVKSYLNTTYKSAVTEWDVKIRPVYVAGTDWDEKSLSSGALVGDNNIDVGGTDVLDAYSDEMNILSSAYMNANSSLPTTNDSYYIFYGLSPSDQDVKGFLPRGKNIGFIFENTSTTIAHELGHGLTLQHTWDLDAKPERGSTDNLMDYKAGTDKELWKSQWEIVAYPKVVVAFLESDEESELLDISNMQVMARFKDADGTITFMTPSGAPFAISFSLLKSVTFSLDDVSGGSIDDPFFPNGTLFGFKLTNGQIYQAYRSGKQFTGYKTPDKALIYKDIYSKNHTTSATQNVCVGFPKIESGRYHFIIKKLPYDDDLLNPWDNWPTADHYGLGDFTDDPDVDYDDPATTAILNYARTSIEDQAFLGLNSGQTDPDIIRACVKVSNVIIANPGLYNAYLGCNGQVIKGYLEWLRTTTKPSGEYDFVKLYVRYLSEPTYGKAKDLINYKNGLARQSATVWLTTLSNLVKSSTASSNDIWKHFNGIDCLDQSADVVYKSIPLNLRLKSIKMMVNNTYVDETSEGYLIQLIKNTPVANQKNLLDSLASATYKQGSYPHLLAQLYSRITDDNFVLLTQEIFRMIRVSFPGGKSLTYHQAINQKKFIMFDPSTWIGDFVFKTFESDGKVKLLVLDEWFQYQSVTVSPYDFVYIKFEDVFKYGSGQKLTFPKGSGLALPACLMYSVFNEINNKRIIAGTKLAVDIGLCFLGVEEIKLALEAASTARKVYLTVKASADLLSGLSDIIISDLFIEQIQNIPDKDGDGVGEGQEFLDEYYTYQLYYGVGSIGLSGLDVLVNKLYQKAADVKKISDVADDTKHTLDELIEDVENETHIANSTGKIVNHIEDADIASLNAVTSSLRSDGSRAINSVKTLVNDGRALVVKPIANSTLAQKMDNYMAAYSSGNSALQGQLGEEITELMAKEANASGDVLSVKINNSDNGFDLLSFEPDKTNPTSIKIFESKPMNGTSVVLPNTVGSGTQMGNTWTQNNITLMINHADPNISALGNTMLQNASRIEKFVVTIDKDLKQVIILRLDNF